METSRERARWLVGIALAGCARAAAADDAQRLCDRAAQQLDTLASMHGTLCIVTAASGANRGKSQSFIVVAPKYHTSTVAGRDALATAVCGVFGYALNATRSIRAEEIWISDVAAIKQRQAYSIKAELCVQLQPQVKSGAISMQQMQSQVGAALVLRTAPLTR